MKNSIKKVIFEALKISIGLPVLAAGFIAVVIGAMGLVFGIPYLLYSYNNPILHTIGVVWGSLSVIGFFGYILVMMES